MAYYLDKFDVYNKKFLKDIPYIKVIHKEHYEVIDKKGLFNTGLYLLKELGFSYRILKQEFLKNFNPKQPLNYYPIHSFDDMTFLLFEYYRNPNFIKSCELKVIYPYSEDLSIENNTAIFAPDLSAIFYFEFIVNINELLNSNFEEKHTHKAKNNQYAEKNKPRNKFSKQQYILYRNIEKYVKATEHYAIDEDSLRQGLKESVNLNTAVGRLNKQYQLITGRNNKIIEYSRIDKLYIIDDNWNINNIK